MPSTLTYPGVYVEEIASGVRTITGVGTSITAFVGRTLRGPVNSPVTINSYADFQRTFGGLWTESPLSFAVRDYFMNGGSQAIVVRLFHPLFADDTARTGAFEIAKGKAQDAADAVETVANKAAALLDATADDVADAAELEAAEIVANPLSSAAAILAANALAAKARAAANASGATADSVKNAVADPVKAAIVEDAANEQAPITIAHLDVDTLKLTAANEGAWGNRLRARVDHDVKLGDASLFNLAIKDEATGLSEIHRNVSVSTMHARRVDKVLAGESQLARAIPPAAGASRPVASAAPIAGKDPFDSATSTGVLAGGLASDGKVLDVLDYEGSQADKTGLYALENADLFNILCIPPFSLDLDVTKSLWSTAASYCERRRAMLIVDAPSAWTTKGAAISGLGTDIGSTSKNAALFFPRLVQPNPLHDGQMEVFAACGAVAGTFARTDTQRGVWKAPAGLDATLNGVPALSVSLTDAENGELNPLGINCLRTMPAAGRVVWGSRTLQGDDRLASEWKYIPVRRTALFIEESLYRGTQWVVFEPNDEPLWAQIRLNIGAFMHNLFRQGAFQGKTPKEAYLVKCDKETTTQNDINLGVVNIIVGFAPLKPAEFVVIKIQQLAGQIAS